MRLSLRSLLFCQLTLAFFTADVALAEQPTTTDVVGLPVETESVAAPSVDAETASAYANWLLRHDDPYNALTWYRLGLFLDPDRADAADLRFRIGLAYELGSRWQAAEVAYGQVADPQLEARSAYRAALALRSSGNLAAVDQQLAAMSQFYPDTEWAERAVYARGLVHLHAHDLQTARVRFAEVPVEGNRWGIAASNLVVALEEPLPSRSPVLAAGLSTLIPGMGKVYAGQGRDGLMSFVVNGVLGLWSYTLVQQGLEQDRAWQVGMGAAVGTTFAFAYSANIVGSWRAAGRFSDQKARDRAAELLGQLYDPALELDARDVSLD